MKLQRHSLRLPRYNYSQNRQYFITICSYQHESIFGDIVNGKVLLNRVGKIVTRYWSAIPKHFNYVFLDNCIVMPNHLHGILYILAHKNKEIKYKTLGIIIRSFKAAVTKEVRIVNNGQITPIWQRNYHEYIIRDQEALDNFRKYIKLNPQRWKGVP